MRKEHEKGWYIVVITKYGVKIHPKVIFSHFVAVYNMHTAHRPWAPHAVILWLLPSPKQGHYKRFQRVLLGRWKCCSLKDCKRMKCFMYCTVPCAVRRLIHSQWDSVASIPAWVQKPGASPLRVRGSLACSSQGTCLCWCCQSCCRSSWSLGVLRQGGSSAVEYFPEG